MHVCASMPYTRNFISRLGWGMVANALDKSNSTCFVGILRLKLGFAEVSHPETVVETFEYHIPPKLDQYVPRIDVLQYLALHAG